MPKKQFSYVAKNVTMLNIKFKISLITFWRSPCSFKKLSSLYRRLFQNNDQQINVTILRRKEPGTVKMLIYNSFASSNHYFEDNSISVRHLSVSCRDFSVDTKLGENEINFRLNITEIFSKGHQNHLSGLEGAIPVLR